MGRQPTIDRNVVLNVVEALVREKGVAGLTIGAVAKAAGISKGGVQSAFGSKDQLIQAIFDRWTAEYDAEVTAFAGDTPTGTQAAAAHVEITRKIAGTEADRAAGFMTAMLASPDIRTQTSGWYRQLFDRVDFTTTQGRATRLALMATEGAFLLRSFGILQMTPQEWESVFEDIERLLQSAVEDRPATR